MYRKNSSGWSKHIDFILLDLFCVQLAFYISYVMRQGDWNPYVIPIYRHMAIFIELENLTIIFLFEAYKNVLKRGYYKEAVASIKQSFMLLLVCSLYLITMQDGNDYSRVSLFIMGVVYGLLTYIIRILWKGLLHHRMKNGEDVSLVIVTSQKIAKNVVRNLKEKNYGMYKLSGVIVVDRDMYGTTIGGVPVVANADNAAEYLLQNWVDEVFINVDESVPYPKELIARCSEMGLAVHMNLTKVSDSTRGKQFIGRVGDYTVITSSINVMTMRQAFIKRTIDILAGIIGCIATGVIFIFVAPVIYIKSPGPIFFAQERIGQNGKTFKMYKFRSMYMDAEERKAELMKENKMSNNLMFKMDFDPRIIGNKILPDGTKKTGIGQFIRSTSLDEFPQFYNVLMGKMSLVGFRPCLKSEYEKYDFHH
ncbi:hypothetical protein EfmE1162_0222, partial [Enterococcus faecium E1162]